MLCRVHMWLDLQKPTLLSHLVFQEIPTEIIETLQFPDA